MGRVARILSALLPAAVETFVLEPQQAWHSAFSDHHPALAIWRRFENRAEGALQIARTSQPHHRCPVRRRA